jgi:DNA-nicking Smr family endonuclease
VRRLLKWATQPTLFIAISRKLNVLFHVAEESHGIIYKMPMNKNMSKAKTERVGDEIDLHGLTVDEAIPKLE